MGFVRSGFPNFENFLRIVVDLDECDIQLILTQFYSNFVTYEILPGIYSIEDLSEAVDTMGDHEGTPQIEYGDVTMKTNIILNRFSDTFGTLRFDQKYFVIKLLGFTPYWDYKPHNSIQADSPGVYTNEKIFNWNTIDKYHLKCDVNDSSVVNGRRESKLFGFVLDTPSSYKLFCQPETIHYKVINKSVLNTITIYLENNNHEEVDFNGETLTFT